MTNHDENRGRGLLTFCVTPTFKRRVSPALRLFNIVHGGIHIITTSPIGSPVGRVQPARLHIRPTETQNPALTGGVLFFCVLH